MPCAGRGKGPVGAVSLGLEGERAVLAAVAGDRARHVVVGEHPGRGSADRRVRRERRVDRLAQCLGVPRPRQEVEVERGVQLVRPQVAGEPLDVGQPHLADEHASLRGSSRRSLASCGRCRAARRDPRADAARAAGSAGTSGSAGSLTSSAAESMRTPATPRSNQKRRMSSCSRRTSGWSQLRSGCSAANRCRYHSPGVPSAFVVRVHAGPPKLEHPAVRRLVAVGPDRAEPEARPARGSRARRPVRPGTRGAGRDMVGDDVDDRPEAERDGLGDQLLGLGEGAEDAGRWRGSRRRRSRRRPAATRTRA